MRRNRHDTWALFCDMHREVLAETGLPKTVTHAEHRFRDLLERGRVEVAGGSVSLEQLTETGWAAVYRFTSNFIREFESFMPDRLFPAFQREVERRGDRFPR